MTELDFQNKKIDSKTGKWSQNGPKEVSWKLLIKILFNFIQRFVKDLCEVKHDLARFMKIFFWENGPKTVQK